jgi:hypothetical protein
MKYTKYPELKAELKVLAKEIRQLKYKRDHWWEFGNDQSEFMWKAARKGWLFRHRHIAYCLLRGRSYEEIERYCREAPDFKIIEKIRADHYVPEVVHSCAQGSL